MTTIQRCTPVTYSITGSGSCSDVQLFAVCIHGILAAPQHVEILEVNVYHLQGPSQGEQVSGAKVAFQPLGIAAQQIIQSSFDLKQKLIAVLHDIEYM